MAHIVLNTFGSLGDLHPFLALATELRKRGHTTLLATSEIYRSRIEAEGVAFAPVRPDVGEMLDKPELIRKVWDPRRGTEFLIREIILPGLKDGVGDLRRAAEDADLMITHSAGYAGPIVAEALNKPWLSVALQPMVFFSAFDPPVFAPAPWLRHFYRLGRWTFSLVYSAARRHANTWMTPIVDLRRTLNLTTDASPLFEGQFSPLGTLALFSRCFAVPQPDWPPNVTVAGFARYDHPEVLAPELVSFLDGGPAPILFTLGSGAVMDPGNFFEESLLAADKLGMRAVLLTGPQGFGKPLHNPPDSVFVTDYVPFPVLMPRTAAIVHQGGIGTTAQALQAGRPMVVVPWGHDQPDNAERIRRLGVGRVIGRKKYNFRAAARELDKVLNEPSYSTKAKQVKDCLATESALENAGSQIDRILESIAVHRR